MTDAPVGTFAEEAARLADAVQAWARGEGSGRSSAAVGHVATGDAVCCVCPVCNLITVLRGERPELSSRLTESVAGLITAGQTLIETLTAVAADGRPAPQPSSGASGNDPGPGRVQNIPLD